MTGNRLGWTSALGRGAWGTLWAGTKPRAPVSSPRGAGGSISSQPRCAALGVKHCPPGKPTQLCVCVIKIPTWICLPLPEIFCNAVPLHFHLSPVLGTTTNYKPYMCANISLWVYIAGYKGIYVHTYMLYFRHIKLCMYYMQTHLTCIYNMYIHIWLVKIYTFIYITTLCI